VGVIWRVSLGESDVDAFIEEHQLSPCAVFRRGEPVRVGTRIAEDSGFNLDIRDDDDYNDLSTEIASFIKNFSSALSAISTLGGSSSLDISLFVGRDDRYTRSIYFGPGDMNLLASVGVELRVSAYPCSDEES
jgi:hypothetical protein